MSKKGMVFVFSCRRGPVAMLLWEGGGFVLGWVVSAGFIGWLKLIVCEFIRVFVIAILYVMCHASFLWRYYDRGREGGDGRLWKRAMAITTIPLNF